MKILNDFLDIKEIIMYAAFFYECTLIVGNQFVQFRSQLANSLDISLANECIRLIGLKSLIHSAFNFLGISTTNAWFRNCMASAVKLVHSCHDVFLDNFSITFEEDPMKPSGPGCCPHQRGAHAAGTFVRGLTHVLRSVRPCTNR
jgi:hypothetical protein